MINFKKYFISTLSLFLFIALALPSFMFAQNQQSQSSQQTQPAAKKVQLQTTATISQSGLIQIIITNPNPKNLKLKAEYGQGDFGLKSNLFVFEEKDFPQRGTAALTGLNDAYKVYQYRIFDTTGVLLPSDTFTFTTSPLLPPGGVYASYPSIGTLATIDESAPTTGPVGTGASIVPSFYLTDLTPTSVTLNASGLEANTMYMFAVITISGMQEHQVAPVSGKAVSAFTGLAPGENDTAALMKYDPATHTLSSSGASPIYFTTPNLPPVVPPSPSVPLGNTPEEPRRPTPSPSSPSDSPDDSDRSGLVPCGKATYEADTEIDGIKHYKGEVIACKFSDFFKLISNIVNFLLLVLAIPISAIMFAYAGFLMLIPGGESASKKTKGKEVFLNVAIGLMLVAGAWLIVHTILTIVGYNTGAEWFGLK